MNTENLGISKNLNVSIVIPVRDNFKGICSLIKALENQDNKNFELIIVDDGSKPPIKIPKNLLKNSQLLRLRSNMGQGIARNMGAKMAKGQLILFTDSDCSPNPQWVSTYVKLYKKGHKIIASSFFPGSNNNLVANLRSDESNFYQLSYEARVNCFTTSNLAIDNKTFHECGGFPGLRVGEDFLLGYKLFNMNENTYWYPNNKVHQNNRTNPISYLHQQFEWAKAVFIFRLILPLVSDMKWNIRHSSLRLQILLTLSVLLCIPFSIYFTFFLYIILTSIMLVLALNFPFISFIIHKRGYLATIKTLIFIVVFRNVCWTASLIRVFISPYIWLGFIRAKSMETAIYNNKKKRKSITQSSIQFIEKMDIISKYS